MKRGKRFSIKLLIKPTKRGWDKSPSLSIVFGLSSKTQWLSGLYYADFISFYSPTQLCGGGTTKSNSNELPISVPLSFLLDVVCCYIRSEPLLRDLLELALLIEFYEGFINFFLQGFIRLAHPYRKGFCLKTDRKDIVVF